ncbi:MAG: hypothetical protein CTY18_06010 [Methylomonas sp.]|nr:MAG: hypothetical protein CTY24_11840 [Methylobacter sp.]PPD36028.1 MAG: hypothetical protein CTY18_06010 [Methylomonas sp.]
MAVDRTSEQFLLNAYSGKGGFATGDYLIAHPRETDEKIARRQELAVYPNYCRKIVDVFMGFLWKQSPTRDVDDLYINFALNADGSGTKLNTLLFVYQRMAMILGTVFVIVDKPRNQGQTRADQAMPYLALRTQSQMAAETKDAAGNWLSVTFSEQDNNDTIYRTYTISGWMLTKDKDGKDVIDQGDYSVGRVPVVRLHNSKPTNPTDTVSDSFFYDLASLNWDLYNLRSEVRELFRAQTFAILTIPVSDSNERERLKDMTISTENALTYNPAGGGMPAYIAPPPEPIELYQKHMADTVVEIYKIANLEFVGGVQRSGVALSFHFQEANSSLAGWAEMGEMAETEIARLVYQWQGLEFNGNISYPSDFNMSDLKESIATAMDTITLGMGQEFDKALKKHLARQILGNDISASEMQNIEAEIDAQGDIYGDRLQQQAGLA